MIIDTAKCTRVKAFLAETLAKLPPDFRLYALRADSGFFVTDFLAELAHRALPYVIAVRMNPHLRRTVAGIKRWTPFGHGLEASDSSRGRSEQSRAFFPKSRLHKT